VTCIELLLFAILLGLAATALASAASGHVLPVTLAASTLVVLISAVSRGLPPFGESLKGLDEFHRRQLHVEGAVGNRRLPWVAWVVGFCVPVFLDRGGAHFFYAWFVLGGLMLVFGVGRKRSVPNWVTVFDKPIAVQPGSGRRAEGITLFLSELRARSQVLGVTPLDAFEEKLAAGAAHHDPRLALTTIEALIAHPDEIPHQEVLIPELMGIRDRLSEAANSGASFCFMRTTAWSGLIETNLQLYWR
jgi:hypothetical protein